MSMLMFLGSSFMQLLSPFLLCIIADNKCSVVSLVDLIGVMYEFCH